MRLKIRTPPTPELALLLLCGHESRAEGREKVARLLDAGLDWGRLDRLAQRHGLGVLLHRLLAALEPGVVPAAVLGRLSSRSEAIGIQNLVLARELVRAIDVLRAAGIFAVPYKGPALAAFLFGNIALREFGDIDILVRPRDALRARLALLANGFTAQDRLSPSGAALRARLHCSFSFSTLGGRALLELNWRTVPRYWCLPEIPESAWATAGTLPLLGSSVPWFLPQHLAFVLCLHGCKHKWESLKWVVDVATLVRAHPDAEWNDVLDYARATGSARMLALGLFLSSELMEAPLPAPVQEAIRSDASIPSLAAEVCELLFAADRIPQTSVDELRFVARLTQRARTRISCELLIPTYALLHRVVRPSLAAARRAYRGES